MPVQKSRYIFELMSFAERVFHVFKTWGRKAIVVSAPATKPVSEAKSGGMSFYNHNRFIELMETVFQGKLYTIKQGEKKEEVKERAERCPSVAVIPFTKDGGVILLREYRREHGRTIIGLVWGRVDKESDLETAAKRELAEEAKLKAEKIELFYKTKPDEAIEWDRYIYVATGLSPAKASHDEDEQIESFECTLEEACELAMKDNFRGEVEGYAVLKLRHDLEKGLFELP